MKQNKSSLTNFIHRHLAHIILFLIIITAIFFRFYKLDALPPGLHPDEAANGLDIFRMIDHHDFRVLYNTNGPREALFFYLQAIFVVTIGNVILALRIAPAIIGTLAVVMAYLWATDWFGRRTGLVAAFIFAVSPWAVTITRDGFRASMVPLMIASVAYLAGKAYKTQKIGYFIAAGVVAGLGLYTYVAFQLFVGIVILALGYLLILRRQWFKSSWRKIGLGLISLLVVLSPMIIFTIKHPADSFARSGGTSFMNKSLNGGKPLQTLVDSSVKTLLMFNFKGDTNYRHNLGGLPMLNVFIGVMMLLGIFVCLARLGRLKYFMVLAIFATMLLPAALTAESLPHALRAVGAMPAVFIIAAVGINYFLSRWYATFPVNGPARNFGASLIALLLVLTAFQGYKQYFVAWAQDPKTYEAYAEDMVQAAYYLNQYGIKGNSAEQTSNFLVVDGYSVKTIEYLARKKADFKRLDLSDLRNLPLGSGKKLFIVAVNGDTDAALETLRSKYPGGHLGPHYSPFNDKILFYSYEVQ